MSDVYWPGDGEQDPRREGEPTAPTPQTGQSPAGDHVTGEHPTGEHPTEDYRTAPAHPTQEFAPGAPFVAGTPVAAVAPAPREPGSRRATVKLAAIVGVTALVFGGVGIGVGAAVAGGSSSSPSTTSFVNSSVSSAALSRTPTSYAGIAAKVLPSVVSINVQSRTEADTGSGVILESDGYILTNNHVVAAAEGGAGTVSVTFNNGSSTSARIVGTDSLDDLAVIKVAKTGLTPANLGQSSQLAVGDAVLAIGSPLGLSGTVTNGIVSALNRPVQTEADTQSQTNPFGGGRTQTTQPTVIDAIQTDAPINPGNSGGALVNSAGQVIGINSAIASLGESEGSTQSGSIGVGFAIPIDQARVIANELITSGKAVHPLLGVTLEDTSSTSSTTTAGAIVHSVVAGGPASKAGIQKGDIITAVDGQSTPSTDAVIAAIRTHQPGQQVSVTVIRDGSTKTVTATLTTESSSTG